MTSTQYPEKLQRQMEQCPIHQTMDIELFLKNYPVSQNLWEVFHWIVVTRGRYPKNISDREAGSFGGKAYQLTIRFKLNEREARTLLNVFEQLMTRWCSIN